MVHIRKGLYIFRRDFRIVDNRALSETIRNCDEMVLVFIFTPEQIKRTNPYFSDPCVQFMIESLKELSNVVDGKVHFFEGDNVQVLDAVRKAYRFDVLGFNRDYTPYARRRDGAIDDWCERKSVRVLGRETSDYTLHNLELVCTKTGGWYKKFTPFYNTASKLDVSLPSKAKLNINTLYDATDLFKTMRFYVKKAMLDTYYKHSEYVIVKGGRQVALRILKNLRAGRFDTYEETRNTMSTNTTLMGAYLKFGCVSIREAYHAASDNEPLIRELYWREFYAYVTYHYPRIIETSSNFDVKVRIRWRGSEDDFSAWCEGKTGVPIVDAGMRQLLATGWMHNRSRMITASFLIKHLGVDWRKGERFFASKLVDYDPCSNNGGWQWSAGTGVDAQPYYRIFNPWEQARKHDPNCVYIKRWIPELRDVSVADILSWDRQYAAAISTEYPKPIVDHSSARNLAKRAYSRN